jgi:hypothetical protein
MKKKKDIMNNQVECNRKDGCTLVFCSDSEGCYLALFDDQGRNLQHISLDNDEFRQLKTWVNDLPQKLDAKQLWYKLYHEAREKGYRITSHLASNFAIYGHPSGWPSVWSASIDGLERARGWLKQQGRADKAMWTRPMQPSEDERIERRGMAWEEHVASRGNEPYVPDGEDLDYEGDDRVLIWESHFDAMDQRPDGY